MCGVYYINSKLYFLPWISFGNEEGFGSVHASMQQLDAPKLESPIITRIEYLSSIDMDKAESERNVLWMSDTVERVSDWHLFNALDKDQML